MMPKDACLVISHAGRQTPPSCYATRSEQINRSLVLLESIVYMHMGIIL